MGKIYFDHSASTPVRDEVIAVMTDYLKNTFGNPSSVHTFGLEARKLLEQARKQIADGLGVSARQIIFTSGGTEANNLALQGTALSDAGRGRHIITSSIEHKSVLATCNFLEKMGFRITLLPVNGKGIVTPEILQNNICEDTAMVSIMYSNNEIGTIQPIKELAACCKERGIVFHTDAVQATGKIEVDFTDSGVQMLSFSGHKINGPKGVGALVIEEGLELEAVIHGGGHESGYRGGTENLAGIIGLSKAVECCLRELGEYSIKVSGLRDELQQRISEKIPWARFNGCIDNRLPHLLHVSFPGVLASDLQMALDAAGIAVSAGSACSSGDHDYSHVLHALGLKRKDALGSIRISLGRDNNSCEVDTFIDTLIPMVEALKK